MRDEISSAEQIRRLTERLNEAEETLRAVRSGEIDAFIVQGPRGEQIFALRSAEQPYRNLIEAMLEGAAILTTEGDIAYCNKRFAELVSMPLEAVVGGSMERFIAGTDRPSYRSLLAAGSGKRRARLAAADGRTIDVLLSFNTSVTDEVERRNLIVTDISELLVAQQQSQAKDEFMAMLAHELRNPLSAITAAVQVLETANGRESALARARLIIGRQVNHLSRMVDDLLDVGRVVTGKIALDRRAIDLCDLVRRTSAVFTERDAEHSFSMNTAQAWIDGDAVRMEQVVANIIGNAVKYTPIGGKVTISLSIEGEDAVLRVQDDGFGIAPDLLPRVFDLFVQGEQTLDRSQGGLGIGLTLVRRLVELHNGSVTVSSAGANCGSLFTVRLPKVPAVGAQGNAGDEPRASSTRRRVVIIEDNRDAREMFRMMLELEGHQVTEAEEGLSGLRLLRTQPFDVAFIDVGLPGIDGYEIARRFRSEAAAIERRGLLVALTGYGTPDALERSRRAGFDHHLIKPVNPEALYRLLNADEVAGHGIADHLRVEAGTSSGHISAARG